MRETAISVADAAKDFLRLLEVVERKREPAILVREGKAVATLTPVPETAHNCAELADRWLKLERLAPNEGEAFAADIEHARANLPSPKPSWD